MTHNQHLTRTAGALGTVVLSGLLLAGPATADTPMPGDLRQVDSSSSAGTPSGEIRHPESTGNGGSGVLPGDVRRVDTNNPAPKDDGSPGTRVLVGNPADDNAVEYLQIGLGALAGMVVIGAGVAAANGARRHGHAPA